MADSSISSAFRSLSRGKGTILLALILAMTAGGCGHHVPGQADASTGTIKVTVTEQGSPVAGAMCELSDAKGVAIDQEQSDAQGQADFKNVPPADGYVIKAEKGGATGQADNIRVTGGASPVLATVILQLGNDPTAIVLGHLTDSLTGAPVAGAKVQAGGISATSTSDGAYELDKVPAGSQTLKVSASGYNDASKDLALKSGSSQTIDVDLDPTSQGRRAGHTIVTTAGRVIEYDTFHDPLMTIDTQAAYSACYVPANDTILIADAARWGGIAAEIDAQGVERASFDAAKLGVFGHVKGIHGADVTPSGNVLIADTGNNRIVEVDASDNVVWQYQHGLSAPSWAERMPNGDTLITDTGNNRIIELNPSGTIVFAIGDGGTDVLNHPTHAQYLKGSDTFLVTDAGNNRVMEINRQDLVTWMADNGKYKLDDGTGLNNPQSAIRLPGGNTLIADTGNNRVIEVNTADTVVWRQTVNQPMYADRI